jgi:hypothetical protein
MLRIVKTEIILSLLHILKIIPKGHRQDELIFYNLMASFFRNEDKIIDLRRAGILSSILYYSIFYYDAHPSW